jgi:RNA polymerase sigma-70 factor (ECF subfamily)
VVAAAGGDARALETLLERAQHVAYRFSVMACGHAEDAEDVMQEALIKTFRYIRRIDHPEFFKTWLYRTVRNACLMKRRRRVDEPAHLLSLDQVLPGPVGDDAPIDPPSPARSPEQVVVNRRLRRRLTEALKGLPGPFRIVVFLREIEGLSTRDVAKVLGISEANVKTRLHRARLQLRHVLEGR